MSAKSFSVGDLVQLKAGGPVMAVQRVVPIPGEETHYSCQWFAGKKLELGRFPEASLQVPKDKANEP